MSGQSRPTRRQWLQAAAGLAFVPSRLHALPASDEEVSRFLANAEIVSDKELGTGITASHRLTLRLDGVDHYAHWQDVDEAKTQFQTNMGTELNFRDCWKFNVAGYKLDRLLGLHMTPVSVARRYRGKEGAITWWVDDTMMEVERMKKKLNAPDPDDWNCQMYMVRVFDQLIFNTDRNLQNLLIDKNWKIWMIDHTRAFRLHSDLKSPKDLVRCERKLKARLLALDLPTLEREMNESLRPMEIKALIQRRDKIISVFDKLCKQRGESVIMYDYLKT
jgi:hypothetical protein